MLLVRRIPKREVETYDLFKFTSDTRAGYPIKEFVNYKAIIDHLDIAFIDAKIHGECKFIAHATYYEEPEFWFFAVDVHTKETHIVKVDVEIKLTFKVKEEK
jgi:hypothetical protein